MKENEQAALSALHMVVVIVDGGKSEKVIKICREARVMMHYVSLGHGTARTEMLDLLGLGETPKDAVMCLVPGHAMAGLLETLAEKMQMRYPGKGIAFAIPLNGASGRLYHALITENGEATERKEQKMEEEKQQYDLVAALINRGYSELVMDAARKQGAHGGTVLNTRGLADEEVEKFLGISIQAEKEIVFLVVPHEQKQEIMQAISQASGLKSPAKGTVISLPVSAALGLA